MGRALVPGMSRESLKTLLVRRSILSVDQVARACAAAQHSGGTWLEHLLVDGILDEARLVDWIAFEAKMPRVEVAQLSAVPHHVIAQIPPEVAFEHRLMPVSIEQDGYLQVAMADPIDEAAVEEVEFFAGLRLIRHVAPPTTIAWALHRYYGAASLLWPRAEAAAENAVLAV
jgi:hypothetical protein